MPAFQEMRHQMPVSWTDQSISKCQNYALTCRNARIRRTLKKHFRPGHTTAVSRRTTTRIELLSRE